MKLKAFIFACIITMLIPAGISAQYENQIPDNVPANNGELDWLVFKDRNGSVKLEKKEVVLKSNTKSIYANGIAIIKPTMTFAKLPLNMNGDFYVSATMKPDKINDKTLFGLVFNCANEADYNAILFDNQFCYFVRVHDMFNLTQLEGLQDRVRYKYQKIPKDMWKISIERHNGGDYIISLNGIEVRTISGSLQFPLPCVGACITNKGEVKVTEVSFEQYSVPSENE